MKLIDYVLGGVVITGLVIADLVNKKERFPQYKRAADGHFEIQNMKESPSTFSSLVEKIVIGSIVGTSVMTAYSYWKSYKKEEQFEEPILLGKMLHRLYPFSIPFLPSLLCGWVGHYSIGLLFNLVYGQVWNKTNLRPGIASGILLGIPSGIIGMAMWAAMLKLHPNPPHTHLKEHLKQLFTAHIIFGIGSGVSYGRLQ